MSTWSSRSTWAAVAVAAVIAGLGGASIYAATDGGGSPMMGGPGGPPPHAAAPPAAGLDPEAASLHGEFVTADGHGGYTTLITHTGKLTALSPASVTVQSEDGFVRTYTVPSGTALTQFAVGDSVSVRATREGEAAVANTVRPPLASGR